MATFKTFEELEIWQLARIFVNDVYKTWSGSERFEKDYALKDQINKSNGSIMDNIAEGFERGGTTEFINFLSIAKASTAETQSQLFRALDRNYINQDQFKNLYDRGEEIRRKIGAFINYLKSVDHKGIKYKPQTKN